ncbi:hypothetical protein CEXT_251961 [Caerostris extrusa]|uniref:Uncharacterized protein n=1 Tax=Caerostris extrusa TaxID=172846 RepID=A0AAV4WC82_CAEEX|nr:hypothetical protein CEXT_251961 [Caerostris extrusa]
MASSDLAKVKTKDQNRSKEIGQIGQSIVIHFSEHPSSSFDRQIINHVFSRIISRNFYGSHYPFIPPGIKEAQLIGCEEGSKVFFRVNQLIRTCLPLPSAVTEAKMPGILFPGRIKGNISLHLSNRDSLDLRRRVKISPTSFCGQFGAK